jgi:flagellar hook protein FlgE
MNITNAINSAVSALNAYSVRQAVTANNIANEITPGFVPTEANMSESADGGVTVTLSQPQNSNGVDEAGEMVNMIINKAGFEANLTTIQTSEKMYKAIDKLV